MFDLLGHDANDLTAALGFTWPALALMNALLPQMWPAATDVDASDISAALEVRNPLGPTDLELRIPGAEVRVSSLCNPVAWPALPRRLARQLGSGTNFVIGRKR
jgi:hypothetical protein